MEALKETLLPSREVLGKASLARFGDLASPIFQVNHLQLAIFGGFDVQC